MIKSEQSNFILYSTEDGYSQIKLFANNGTVWLSQAQIAKILNRDRSTLVSSEKLVKDTMDKDPSFAYDIKELIRNLQQ